MSFINRRSLLIGGAALAAGWWLRPSNQGGDYSPYFADLNDALKRQNVASPSMLLDLDRLDANIKTLRASVTEAKTYRIVVKSLPSIDLLKYVMQQANTKSLMAFHQPFLNQLVVEIPEADILLGKPLPVAAARQFYADYAGGAFLPETQLQWLVDSVERVKEYQALAQDLGIRMQLNFEIDVGMHRGGFDNDEALLAAIDVIKANREHLEFSGFMGYEAHLAKLPGVERNLKKVKARYHHMIDVAREHAPELFERDLTFNTAGSQTYHLYEEDDFFNDISAGSCLVKPSDFDLDSLQGNAPACFIATPILKQYDTVKISGLGPITKLMSWWNPNRQKSYYIYGGYWKARYENPPGLSANPIWGHSTNQEMVNASKNVALQVNDFIFMRPTQSEFVFLQFGDLLATRKGKIESRWAVLSG